MLKRPKTAQNYSWDTPDFENPRPKKPQPF